MLIVNCLRYLNFKFVFCFVGTKLWVHDSRFWCYHFQDCMYTSVSVLEWVRFSLTDFISSPRLCDCNESSHWSISVLLHHSVETIRMQPVGISDLLDMLKEFYFNIVYRFIAFLYEMLMLAKYERLILSIFFSKVFNFFTYIASASATWVVEVLSVGSRVGFYITSWRRNVYMGQ